MGNIFKVLTSPQRTFERMREERGAGWVAAMITLMVLGGVVVWLQLPAIFSFTETTLRQQPNLDENVLVFTKAATIVGGYVGAILKPAISMFLGGLLLLLVNLFVRGEATYMQLSKVALYASVPSVVGGLITGILVRVTGATSPYQVSINAGAFFTDKHGWGYALCTLLDPFALWWLVLLIIGTAVMTRCGRSKVALWIIIGWAIVKVFSLLSLATQK